MYKLMQYSERGNVMTKKRFNEVHLKASDWNTAYPEKI